MTCLSALRKSRSFGEQVGCACIPERWLAPLELREVIDQVAVDIDEVPRAYGGEYGDDRIRDEQIWQRYPEQIRADALICPVDRQDDKL